MSSGLAIRDLWSASSNLLSVGAQRLSEDPGWNLFPPLQGGSMPQRHRSFVCVSIASAFPPRDPTSPFLQTSFFLFTKIRVMEAHT